jgi:hypothetical protein
LPRRIASSSPSPVRASVRAMISVSARVRASTATSILRHMSAAAITRRFGVWPHFFGISWSSIWIACTPAAS